jgi:hypothetical protein
VEHALEVVSPPTEARLEQTLEFFEPFYSVSLIRYFLLRIEKARAFRQGKFNLNLTLEPRVDIMPRRVKKVQPFSGFSKAVRKLHSSNKKLESESYSLKSITKQHGLFGKAKQQTLNAVAKQELREACLSTLECAKSLMENFEALDSQRQITDRALEALYMYHKQHERQVHIFVPSATSKMWSKPRH